jgi:hypothetical protein
VHSFIFRGGQVGNVDIEISRNATQFFVMPVADQVQNIPKASSGTPGFGKDDTVDQQAPASALNKGIKLLDDKREVLKYVNSIV